MRFVFLMLAAALMACADEKEEKEDFPALDAQSDLAADASGIDAERLDVSAENDVTVDVTIEIDATDDASTEDSAGATDDALSDLCLAVRCEAGKICNSATGDCETEQVLPGAACQSQDQCVAGRCVIDVGYPNGFCKITCENDDLCAGGRCALWKNEQVCLEACGDCRSGWSCRGITEQGEPYCLPDCHVTGCKRSERCVNSGDCEPIPECIYDCREGETCLNHRCVRADGSCVTDYHCAVGETCDSGRCVPEEMADCSGNSDCDARRQICIPTTSGGGYCLWRCENDEDCPLDRVCTEFQSGKACYYQFCGASQNNGTLFFGCNAGSQAQWTGSCIPFNDSMGYCAEAGDVLEGGACDAQVKGRSEADRRLTCGVGLLCLDDPDDPLDPDSNGHQRGVCTRICDPSQPYCSGNRVCVDYSSENLTYGFCSEIDCSVSEDDCSGLAHCRPYRLTLDGGLCGFVGTVREGGGCQSSSDCADHAICANAGDGSKCIRICMESSADCDCYLAEDWAFGLCL